LFVLALYELTQGSNTPHTFCACTAQIILLRGSAAHLMVRVIYAPAEISPMPAAAECLALLLYGARRCFRSRAGGPLSAGNARGDAVGITPADLLAELALGAFNC